MKYSEIEVISPGKLDGALRVLAEKGTGCRVIAGGTDVVVGLSDGTIKERCLLDVSRVSELKRIRSFGGWVHVGAGVTLAECLEDPSLGESVPLLCEAISQVGSTQIRNLATLAGNVCNASPAADSLPPLYALEATLTLRSSDGGRKMAVSDFIAGPRKTVRRPDELVIEVSVPCMKSGDGYFFEKLGLRSSRAIAVASVAGLYRVGDPRVALGAVAPTVVRARAAEEMLKREGLSEASVGRVCALVASAARPIDDIRGSARFRKRAVFGLAYEGFHRILRGEAGCG